MAKQFRTVLFVSVLSVCLFWRPIWGQSGYYPEGGSGQGFYSEPIPLIFNRPVAVTPPSATCSGSTEVLVNGFPNGNDATFLTCRQTCDLQHPRTGGMWDDSMDDVNKDDCDVYYAGDEFPFRDLDTGSEFEWKFSMVLTVSPAACSDGTTRMLVDFQDVEDIRESLYFLISKNNHLLLYQNSRIFNTTIKLPSDKQTSLYLTMQHYISDVMESDIVAFRIIKDADLTKSFTNVLSGSFHPAVIKLGYPSLSNTAGNAECFPLSNELCAKSGFSVLVRPRGGQHLQIELDEMMEYIQSTPNCNQKQNILYVCSQYYTPCAVAGEVGEFVPECGLREKCRATVDSCANPDFGEFNIFHCDTLESEPCGTLQGSVEPGVAQFHGTITNIDILDGVALTDREIIEAHTGTFPEIRGRSDCLCPEKYPIADHLSMTCSNPTRGQISSRFPNGTMFLPEMINDDSYDTMWLAQPGTEMVRIGFQLERPAQVTNMDINMIHAVPSQYLKLSQRMRDGSMEVIWKFQRSSCGPTNEDTTDVRCLSGLSLSAISALGQDPALLTDYLELTLVGSAERVIEMPVRRKRVAVSETYGIANFNVMGLPARCECFPGGITADSPVECVVGQCKCRNDVDKAYAGERCEPYISSITPNYGPLSGGTSVTLQGNLLTPQEQAPIMVFLGGSQCEITKSNDTFIFCVTTPGYVADLPQMVNIHIGYNDYRVRSDHNYTYKEDPIIVDVQPYESFIKGGVILTVYGQNLASVYHPYMFVDVYRYDQHIAYEQSEKPCTTVKNNATYMLCQTPDLQNIHGHIDRRKRHVRERREAGAGVPVNSDEYSFYLGFELDGVTDYTNITEALPEKGEIQIYRSPEIESFGEKLFKTYNPGKQETIKIHGEKLNWGCQMDDYRIEIGGGEVCEIEILRNNMIQCRPPSRKPAGSRNPVEVAVVVGNINQHVGSLKYEDYIHQSQIFLICMIVAGILLVLILILCVACFMWRRRKRPEHYPTKQQLNSMPRRESKDFLRTLPRELNERVSTHIIAEELVDVHMQCSIGSGNFGLVYRGTYHKKPVAVKVLKDQNCSESAEKFLREALTMSDFQHKNVLSLVGITLKDGQPHIIVPLMEQGDLKSYVASRKTLSVDSMVDICSQVCCGMQYLEQQKYVHRDLAARNCLVSMHMSVKVCDFGYTRDIYSSDYYQQSSDDRVPVRWLALESLKDFKYTSKSDVWSFGVLMWEVFSGGEKPYRNVLDNQDIRPHLQKGYRLERQPGTPDDVDALMQSCWYADPDSRPSFADLHPALVNILQDDYISPSGEDSEDFLPDGDYVDMSCNKQAQDDYLKLIDPEAYKVDYQACDNRDLYV